MRYIISHDKTSVACREAVRNQAGQDKQHHIAWAGIFLLATTGVFFPLTMASILLNIDGFPLITAMTALVLVFVLNIAAMSARCIIPAFFQAYRLTQQLS